MAHALVRIFAIVLGCVAIAWGTVAAPIFWRHAAVESIATRVMDGQPFKASALTEWIPVLDAIEAEWPCRPSAMRSAAIVRFRIAEDTLADGDREHIDARADALRASILGSLRCSPADSFLWLALYWVEVANFGFRSDHLRFLRMSYDQGPREGWVAARRNRAALVVFSQLPPDLAERALEEFVAILRTGFIGTAADLLLGPGWPIRDTLLARIATVPELYRFRLAQILRERGSDLVVPGVPPPPPARARLQPTKLDP